MSFSFAAACSKTLATLTLRRLLIKLPTCVPIQLSTLSSIFIPLALRRMKIQSYNMREYKI